jgi:hypothetical protein
MLAAVHHVIQGRSRLHKLASSRMLAPTQALLCSTTAQQDPHQTLGTMEVNARLSYSQLGVFPCAQATATCIAHTHNHIDTPSAKRDACMPTAARSKCSGQRPWP